MSDDSQRNSTFNAVANTKVHHAQLGDLAQYTPEKLRYLQKAGIRNGAVRGQAQTQQMLEKIPPSQRAGVDGQSATGKIKEYLADKDASHITPHSKGGSSHPDNLKWENKVANNLRGDRQMTVQEQMQLNVKAQIDNVTGALKAGLEAAPKGAAMGAITTAPFSLLRNTLRVARGEISATDAAIETVKETAIGGGVGAATALTVTTVAAACPPVAVALTAVSPVLLVAGGVGMVYEFFKILDDHEQLTKENNEMPTQDDVYTFREIEIEEDDRPQEALIV
jgi:hypothetical protein